MGVKNEGKVWKIITRNEKKYKLHQQQIKNAINQNTHSKSSQKQINFTRKIVPLITDDALNVIDRNIIIQRHSIFQKETQNAYNQHQLKNIYELLFKNEKDYHIQRQNIKTTGISSESTPQPFLNNTNNINKTETSEYILQDLNSKANNNINNYCNMSYNKAKKIIPINNLNKNNIKKRNIRQTFYSLLHTKMFSPHKEQSKDIIEFIDMDNELQKNNENYLKNQVLFKLKKKYPFFKRNDNRSSIKHNHSNIVNILTHNKGNTNSNSPKYNVVLNTYNSMKNITSNEQFIKHQKYIEELRQHFSNCPSKRYISFKNKTRRSCYNESQSSRNLFDDISNIKLNKVSQKTPVPKLKKIFTRNIKRQIDSHNSSK